MRQTEATQGRLHGRQTQALTAVGIPRATILGCAGPRLSKVEADFFRDSDPLGFILFARNCQTPDQVRALVNDLRDAVGRDEAPVLIDQEGGRVVRLRPPHWREVPAPARIGEIFALDPDMGREAARLGARLLAAELTDLGIDVDCTPVLDLRFPDASKVIGDRSFSDDGDAVVDLGTEVCEGLLAGGVLPVIKHLPGHGRARVDSHLEMPVIDTGLAELQATDFKPFRKLAGMPLAMTGHMVFSAIDETRPTTHSPVIIEEVIRGYLAFKGFLISDDLSMEALGGSLGERAKRALEAGCDVALHCNARPEEMQDVVNNADLLSARSLARWQAATDRRTKPNNFDRREATSRFDDLMARAA